MTTTDTEKPIRLLKLPLLVFNRVIQTMSIQDILKFALSSKKTETLVRLGNHKLESFKVELRYFSSPEVIIARSEKDVCRVTMWRDHKGQQIRNGKVLEGYKREQDGNLYFETKGSWEEVFTVSDHLRSLFKIRKYWTTYYLFPRECSYRTITDILPLISWENSVQLVLKDGSIKNETMQYLLDTIPSDVNLYVLSDVESSFKHEKALSFPHILYNEAHWITLDNLKSMRNCIDVKLNRTNFTCEDIRKLIDYWTDCEEDMFRRLTIRLKDNVTHDMDTIIQNMAVVELGYLKNRYIFNTAKKRLLGTIKWEEENKVTLKSLEPVGWYEAVPPILELYERRKVLWAENNRLYNEIVNFALNWDRGVYQLTSDEERNNKLDEDRNNEIRWKEVEAEFDENEKKIQILVNLANGN